MFFARTDLTARIDIGEVAVEAQCGERARQEGELLHIVELEAHGARRADVGEAVELHGRAGKVGIGRSNDGDRRHDVVAEGFVEQAARCKAAGRQVVLGRQVDIVRGRRLHARIALRDDVVAEVVGLRRRDLVEAGPRDAGGKRGANEQFVGQLILGVYVRKDVGIVLLVGAGTDEVVIAVDNVGIVARIGQFDAHAGEQAKLVDCRGVLNVACINVLVVVLLRRRIDDQWRLGDRGQPIEVGHRANVVETVVEDLVLAFDEARERAGLGG